GSAHAVPRRDRPGRALDIEDVRLAGRASVVGPVESYLGGVLPLRAVDQRQLRLQVTLATRVVEAHAHSRCLFLRRRDRAVAKALGTEVAWLLAAAGNRPVLDHGPPGPAAIRGVVDLVAHVRLRRVARGH